MLHENLMTKTEVANDLGICYGTIPLWIKRGDIPPAEHRLGRKVYWKKATIEDAKRKLLGKK